MLSDAQLLDRYSRCHDEQAFAEVVTRYLNLVYSAALRHSDGDTHLAQDVAQNVFSDLARKASELAEKLEQGQPLVGWLYTSAHFAASSLCRSKNRRQNRERMALVMNETTGTSEAESEPEWTALRPLLDEAIDRKSVV